MCVCVCVCVCGNRYNKTDKNIFRAYSKLRTNLKNGRRNAFETNIGLQILGDVGGPEGKCQDLFC